MWMVTLTLAFVWVLSLPLQATPKKHGMSVQNASFQMQPPSTSFLTRVLHPGSKLQFHTYTPWFLTICLSIGKMDTTKTVVVRIPIKIQVSISRMCYLTKRYSYSYNLYLDIVWSSICHLFNFAQFCNDSPSYNG